MKKVLLITLGTGVGPNEDERTKSLAHGILNSITINRPDWILFFGSDKSLKTLESLKEQYFEKMGEKLESFEFVELKHFDEFSCCYESIANKIRELRDHEIVVDYTSGTKTMSVSAAICALLYKATPFVVTGTRGSNGVVKSGAESARQENFFQAYDEILLERALKSFNIYRFGEAMAYLDDIVGLDDQKKIYRNLFEAYSLWDRFEYKKAFEILDNVNYESKQLRRNQKFLRRLTTDQDNYSPILAELLNNAERRIGEGKYDDAVARLYRTIELVSQIKLRELGIDPGNVDINKLRDLGLDETVISEYEKQRTDNGKIMVSLRSGYMLLSHLGDDLGKGFLEDSRLQNLLKKRNSSILAHGLDPVGEEDSKRLFEKTIEHTRKLDRNIDYIRGDGVFPVFGE